MEQKLPFTVVFFQESGSGKEPVRDWIKDLTKKDQKIIGHDLMVVQYNWPLGMPLVKNIGKGLWELRSNLTNMIARVIFIQKKDRIVLLHAFIKKTQKAPDNELDTARRRLKEIKY